MRVYKGTLELDEKRGVIYFHLTSTKMMEKLGTVTLMRICNLPRTMNNPRFIDITHMQGFFCEEVTS